MPALLTNRRFTVNDGSTDTTVTPVNSGLKYRWQLEEGTRFYRKKLATQLLFRKADYQFFKGLYDAATCNSIIITIELFCQGAWRTEFTGKIIVGQGDYHLNRCEVTYDIQPADVYDCFNRAVKKPFNWLAYGSKKNLQLIYGSVETEDCTYIGPPFGAPTSDIYFLKDCWSGGTNDYTQSTDPDPTTAYRPTHQDQSYDSISDTLSIATTWSRETINSLTPPPGAGWIFVSGTKYVRPVLYTRIEETGFVTAGTITTYGFDSPILENTVISNGRLVSEDMFDAMLGDLGCDNVVEVRSDALNINPPGTAPTNDAYTFTDTYFQSLLLFQKSDIVNEDASVDATILLMSFNDFLASMTGCANLYWALEDIGGGNYALRIEHWTYFEAANGLSLVNDFPASIVGTNQFKATTEVPNSEVFNYQESINTQFQKKSINYPIACSDSESDIDYSLSLLSADIGGLLNNSEAGLTGFVIASTVDLGSGNYLIDNSGDILNGAFSWKFLHDSLWPFGRYHMGGTSTASDDFVVQTARRKKEQAKIEFPYCCDTTDFNPVQLIESGLGFGQIKDAEQDTQTDTMSVTLLHE